jgi:hypothetical protein
MDKLFSNIQQTLQTDDKNNLLQNQQISQDKINQLLEQSAESLMCGPTCQKLKITEQLKQKYLDAETNLQTAPVQLEQTKKNYYIYSEGRPFYDNMLEEELTQKSKKITRLLAENFNDEVRDAIVMNMYLNTALINSNYTKELLMGYREKNKALKLKLHNSHGDILTNDRKTYYETEAFAKLKLWYKVWWYMYYILYLVVLIATFIGSSNLLQNMSTSKKIVMHIALFTYPYYIDYIVMKIYGFIMKIHSNLPKNIYNNL